MKQIATHSWRAAVLVGALQALYACAAINPFAAAETLGQQAYSLEASYNIAMGTGLELVADPNVSDSVKERIFAAEAQATPVISAMSEVLEQYLQARAELAAGETTEAQLTVLANNLEGWIAQAEAAVAVLTAAIKAGSS